MPRRISQHVSETESSRICALTVRRLMAACVLSAAVTLPRAAHAQQQPTPPPASSYITAADIFVRSGPDETFAAVGRLTRGSLIVPLSRNEQSTWVMIRYGRGFGWIRSDLAAWVINIDDLPVIEEDNLTPTSRSTIPTPTYIPPTATPTVDHVVVGPEGGFVRSGPGREFPVLGFVVNGDPLEPVGRDPGTDWILIRYGDGFAWIARPLGGWISDLTQLPVLQRGALTPSRTFTATNTLTATSTFTTTATYTATVTATPSPSLTNTPSVTPTYTATPSPSLTSTPSATATHTATVTVTPSPSLTSTPSATATHTATVTVTPSPSLTSTPSATATHTATVTVTPSPSLTSTPSATATHTATVTVTPSPSLTNTPSATATHTATVTVTPSPSPTSTPSATATYTASVTVTPSPSLTNTPSATATHTATVTPSPSPTNTPSATATHTASVTVTPSPSLTSTPLATATHTATVTVTPSPSLTSTPSATATHTATVTVTPSPSLTNTPSATATHTATVTVTPSPSLTNTPSATATYTASVTVTPSPSLTSTGSPTPRSDASIPAERTSVSTEVESATVTPSPSPTVTLTLTPTSVSAVPEQGPAPTIAQGEVSSPSPSLPAELIISGILLALGAIYGGLYWRGQMAADRYDSGFVINRCPICGGDIHVTINQKRVLGIPRVRTTVRCTNCRSILREVTPRHWRYAVDHNYSLTLYHRFNGKIIDEATLVALGEDAPPARASFTPRSDMQTADAPEFIDE